MESTHQPCQDCYHLLQHLLHISAWSEDGHRAYSTAGLAHSIPTSAPGMYRHNNNQRSASGAPLKSHMTEISKTMLQLAQAHKKTANTQKQNHQAMVTLQYQQADAFEALAATTQQQKYDAMFTAVPRYDGKKKEKCAVWLNWISSLATLAGHSQRLELLNRSEGDVTTVIAGMDDTISDDNLKEEIMRCFSNAPMMIQAIGVLRGIRQWQNEQAHLYAARYEFVHNRAHNIQPEEQTQVSEIIHYMSTLLPHLQKKLLKKLNTYRPKSLREAMDVTMDSEVEHQITQPESQLIVMESCYEEPTLEETYTTEVQMRPQAQKQGQNSSRKLASVRGSIRIQATHKRLKIKYMPSQSGNTNFTLLYDVTWRF